MVVPNGGPSFKKVIFFLNMFTETGMCMASFLTGFSVFSYSPKTCFIQENIMKTCLSLSGGLSNRRRYGKFTGYMKFATEGQPLRVPQNYQNLWCFREIRGRYLAVHYRIDHISFIWNKIYYGK